MNACSQRDVKTGKMVKRGGDTGFICWHRHMKDRCRPRALKIIENETEVWEEPRNGR